MSELMSSGNTPKRPFVVAQKSTTENEKALIDLSRTWMQAAVQIESTLVPSDKPQAPRMP
jgi:hypothetical protein